MLLPARPTPDRPALLFAVHSAKLAGAQVVALGQARALHDEFDLTVAIEPGPLRPLFAELGSVVRGPTRLPVWGAPARRWALELARAVPDSLRLAALIRLRRLDAVVVNSTVLVAPVLAARLAGVPVIVHAQEAPKSRGARGLFRFHGAFADTVVAISSWIGNAFGAPRAKLLFNPVGIPVPPPVDRPSRPAGAPLRLVVVGTLDRHKRQDLAVAALADLQRAGVDAHLTLVGSTGDAAYADEVRALAAHHGIGDRVVLPGVSADVAGHLRAADALVLPAGEVTPLVLMEAMAHGTPVIAARMGSIPDVVVDGDSGLLVEPDSPPALAAAVLRLADEPALAASLAAGGRRRVETHFDEQRSHARLRNEILRLIGRDPARPARGLEPAAPRPAAEPPGVAARGA